jgi:hypothetical protein
MVTGNGLGQSLGGTTRCHCSADVRDIRGGEFISCSSCIGSGSGTGGVITDSGSNTSTFIQSATSFNAALQFALCYSFSKRLLTAALLFGRFGRIVPPSDAATESRLLSRGNRENEIARFRGSRSPNLAISNRQNR